MDTSVAETNAHGEDDEEFTSLYPDGLPGNKSGCLIVKPYFTIEWLYLLGYKCREWAWSVDSLNHNKTSRWFEKKNLHLAKKAFQKSWP